MVWCSPLGMRMRSTYQSLIHWIKIKCETICHLCVCARAQYAQHTHQKCGRHWQTFTLRTYAFFNACMNLGWLLYVNAQLRSIQTILIQCMIFMLLGVFSFFCCLLPELERRMRFFHIFIFCFCATKIWMSTENHITHRRKSKQKKERFLCSVAHRHRYLSNVSMCCFVSKVQSN